MTAVLLLIFNRPDTTAKVFEAIREARPARLYVSADGPRGEQAGEPELCTEARRIATNVDWPCKLFTRFQKHNHGCRRAVSDGITWFFEQEEEGVILEDDTVPHPSFFRYCNELLDRYRDDNKVMAICGSAYFPGSLSPPSSYCFSNIFDPWGWATWRRAWQSYDDDLASLNAVAHSGQLNRIGLRFANFWLRIFQDTKSERYDSWAYRWTFSIFRDEGLVIMPRENLISNFGFGPGATHTLNSESHLRTLTTKEMRFPLHHPENHVVNSNRDTACMIIRHGFRNKLHRANSEGSQTT